MKPVLLLISLVSALNLSAQGDSPFVKQYSFGAYTVYAGYCDYYSRLEVFFHDKSVAVFCDGEGGGYSLVDTINLNNDGHPDFICSHYQEDAYFYIVFLVSNGEGYRFIDPDLNYSDPSTYIDIEQGDNKYLKEFAVRDVNADNLPDVILNVFEKEGQLLPVSSRFTDTIPYDMLNWHITPFDTNSYWLPEKYVEAVAAGDTANASDYLFPIAGFYDPFGKCMVVTYKSEALPQLMEITIINGIGKLMLKQLHYKVALDAKPPAKGNVYVSLTGTKWLPMEPFYEQLERSIVTIIKKGGRLLLEITDAAGTEEIYFIDRYKGKKLTEVDFPVRYYQ